MKLTAQLHAARQSKEEAERELAQTTSRYGDGLRCSWAEERHQWQLQREELQREVVGLRKRCKQMQEEIEEREEREIKQREKETKESVERTADKSVGRSAEKSERERSAERVPTFSQNVFTQEEESEGRKGRSGFNTAGHCSDVQNSFINVTEELRCEETRDKPRESVLKFSTGLLCDTSEDEPADEVTHSDYHNSLMKNWTKLHRRRLEERIEKLEMEKKQLKGE